MCGYSFVSFGIEMLSRLSLQQSKRCPLLGERLHVRYATVVYEEGGHEDLDAAAAVSDEGAVRVLAAAVARRRVLDAARANAAVRAAAAVK